MSPLYGPPPDPREVIVSAGLFDLPWAWLGCVVVGLGLAAWARPGRPFLFVLGLVIALTTPAAAMVPRAVWGAFPTIDKAGSLLFYLDGVHTRILDPSDPAVRLIGVHLGHLWVTAAFDLVLEPFAAMNAHGLLNLALSWWAAARLVEAVTGDRRAGLVLGFAYGMNLHQFRDLNWYTIEKSGIWWVPLYLRALWEVRSGGRWWAPALLGAGAFFYNVYLGLLCALGGVLALGWRNARVTGAVAATAVALLPLVGLQWRLMHGEGAVGSPEAFVKERAVLDVVELWPPRWNRLEAWRALNLVAVGLGSLALARRAARWWVLVALVAGTLALGPAQNPVYRLALGAVPGFWRVARPETFFHLAWLAWIVAAGIELAWRRPRDRTLVALGVAFGLGWLVSVRTHPVYPAFTEPVAVELAPEWRRRPAP